MNDTSQAITTTQPNAAALQTVQVFNSFEALEKLGTYIYQSGMFGVRNPAEGFILAVTCQQERMSFMQVNEKFHIMMGKITIKAEAMLANLQELGGEHEIIEKSPNRVAIKLTYKKASYLSEVLWEDIKNESYTRANKDANGRNYADSVPIEQRQFKENYATPRRRMQMMWARAVSDGVRTVCPLATRGHYTPEEAIDFDEPKTINITPAPVAFPQQEAEQPAQAAPVAPSPAPAVPVVEVLPPQEQPQTVTQPTASAPTPEMFKNIGPADLDYTVCKIDGPMNGRKWSDMSMENLKLALEITNPNIYEQDKDHIRALIHQYNAAAAGVKGNN